MGCYPCLSAKSSLRVWRSAHLQPASAFHHFKNLITPWSKWSSNESLWSCFLCFSTAHVKFYTLDWCQQRRVFVFGSSTLWRRGLVGDEMMKVLTAFTHCLWGCTTALTFHRPTCAGKCSPCLGGCLCARVPPRHSSGLSLRMHVVGYEVRIYRCVLFWIMEHVCVSADQQKSCSHQCHSLHA